MSDSNFDFERAFERCDIENREAKEKEESKESEEEESLSFYDLVKSKVLAPVFSGVYFSRIDIKKIAYEFGENIVIDERKKMIEQILKFVDSEKSLKRFFEIIRVYIDSRVEIYKELAKEYPASEAIFDEYIQKTKDAKELLSNIERGEY